MEVLAAKVRTEGFPPTYRLVLLVDKIPSSLRYRHKEGIWYAEKDGFVNFLYWKGPHNEGGFGGRDFEITTVEGRKVILKGPWSSRPGVVHKVGFPECVEASITTRREDFEKGYASLAGYVTLSKARQAVSRFLPDYRLVKQLGRNGEWSWIVQPKA